MAVGVKALEDVLAQVGGEGVLGPTGLAMDRAGAAALVASPNTAPPGGMPGGMITLSANGSTPGTAIVWACVQYGDANKTVTNGRLIAYDAENFGTFPNGEARIMPVWDSEHWNIHFMHNKFNIPVAANGRVYVPTYNATIDVYE